MKIDIFTLFPEMFAPLKCSLIGKAVENNLIDLNIIDFRAFSKSKHGQVDDYVFGGGEGMLLKPEPLYDAIMSVKTSESFVIYLSPKGEVFSQNMAEELSKHSHLIFICGHYEGIDERVIDLLVDKVISIGDFILTGGEIPCMAVVDAISRLVPDVLGNQNSPKNESFSHNLLEEPQYTRPQNFMGLTVPDVLISGHHKNIENWKAEQRESETKKYRPDLYEKYLKDK